MKLIHIFNVCAGFCASFQGVDRPYLESCSDSGGHFFAVGGEALLPSFIGHGACAANRHERAVFDDAFWSKESFQTVRARGCVVSDHVSITAPHDNAVILANGGDYITVDGKPYYNQTRIEIAHSVSVAKLWICDRVSSKGGRFLGVAVRRKRQKRNYAVMAAQILLLIKLVYNTYAGVQLK